MTDHTRRSSPLISWIIEKSFGYLFKSETSYIKWQPEEDFCSITALGADNELLGTIEFRHNWPLGRKSFVDSRNLAVSFNLADSLEAPLKNIVQHEAELVCKKLLKLEARFPALLKIAFPRLPDGSVDWKAVRLEHAELKQDKQTKDTIIKLEHLPCDLDCAFCTRPEEESCTIIDVPDLYLNELLYKVYFELPLASLAEQSAAHKHRLLLGGDEPIKHPDLYSMITLGKLRGHNFIELQTSDMFSLSDTKLVQLKAAGLTSIDMPIYGVSDKVHNDVVGKPGHFSELLRVLKFCRAEKISVKLHSVPLTTNQHECAAIIGFAKQHNARFIGFQYPRKEGKSRIDVDRLVPKLTELDPDVRMQLNLYIPCVSVGKKEDTTINLGEVLEVAGRRGTQSLSSFEMEYAKVCERCSAKETCTGIFKGYLKIFGEAEFKAID